MKPLQWTTVLFIIILLYIFFRFKQPKSNVNGAKGPANFSNNGTCMTLTGCVQSVRGARTVCQENAFSSNMPLQVSTCAIPCGSCYACSKIGYVPGVSDVNLGKPIFPKPNCYVRKTRGAGTNVGFEVAWYCTEPCIDPVEGHLSCNPCIPACFPGTEVV